MKGKTLSHCFHDPTFCQNYETPFESPQKRDIYAVVNAVMFSTIDVGAVAFLEVDVKLG